MRTLHQVKQSNIERTPTHTTRKAKQALYNTAAWKAYTRNFKRANPLCVECLEHGDTSPAWATDHIIPHGGNRRRFWDESNHQALCRECHRRKSQSERID